MFACCDDTTFGDDEHNTDNDALLLFGHAIVAPCCCPACRYSTRSPSRSLAGSPWTFSPKSSRTTLWLLRRTRRSTLGLSFHREGFRDLTRLPADGPPAVLPSFLSLAGEGAHHVHDCFSFRTDELLRVSTPCFDDHQFEEEDFGSVGELSQVCSQIFLNCLYLARIGGRDIVWSVSELARAVTKWTRACDRRLAHLISKIHCTNGYKQFCHVGNFLHNSADWDCFKTLILQGILKTQNRFREDSCASLAVTRLFP